MNGKLIERGRTTHLLGTDCIRSRLVRLCYVFLTGFVAVMITGCNSSETATSDVQVEINFELTPPAVGNVEVSLRLTESGTPVQGAKVRLEGNMNHAGMKPSFADLRETGPGQYAGVLDFTMGGDWYVLVNATTPDGRQIERKVDVPGVMAP